MPEYGVLVDNQVSWGCSERSDLTFTSPGKLDAYPLVHVLREIEDRLATRLVTSWWGRSSATSTSTTAGCAASSALESVLAMLGRRGLEGDRVRDVEGVVRGVDRKYGRRTFKYVIKGATKGPRWEN